MRQDTKEMKYYMKPGEREQTEIENRQSKKIGKALTGKKSPPADAATEKHWTNTIKAVHFPSRRIRNQRKKSTATKKSRSASAPTPGGHLQSVTKSSVVGTGRSVSTTDSRSTSAWRSTQSCRRTSPNGRRRRTYVCARSASQSTRIS